jgi:dipeptidyl aminopeptidase/acylaminoacyl peptidase
MNMHNKPCFHRTPFLAALTLALLLAACGTSPDNTTTAVPTEAAAGPTSGATGSTPEAATATAIPPTSTPEPQPTNPPEPQPSDTPEPQPSDTPVPPSPPEPATSRTVPSATAHSSEILFLRNNTLMAYAPDSGQERMIAADVQEFAATPNGQTLALVRGSGATTTIWLVARSGENLRQLTSDDRNVSGLAWSPDGLTLAYAAATVAPPRLPGWMNWTEWCAAGEVRLLDITSGTVSPLAPGCDPAFAPDGRRIAFAAPPTRNDPTGDTPPSDNSLRLVNRQGENGWDFAVAGTVASGEDAGLLVYAPAWSPGGMDLAYQRFIGYRALVDINYTEMGGSFTGDTQMLNVGAGWLLPPDFAPDGWRMALVEHNFSDARGWGGYEQWETRVLDLNAEEQVALPSGTRTAHAAVLDELPRATGAAWAPDGSGLVVALPPGWSADAPLDQPRFEQAEPGNLWRWTPGSAPDTLLVENVDFASRLVWLPPAPAVEVSSQGYQLVYPAGWQLTTSEFEERTAVAPDGISMISAAPWTGDADELTALSVTRLFPGFVADVSDSGQPLRWPDGSVYRGFTGVTPEGTPVTGAVRIAPTASGAPIALLYRTTPERWLQQRATAQALLAAGGPTE